MTRPEQALDLFARQFNCAQAILATYGPAEDLSEPDCLRIAAPFGGGIGRLGETCGAVAGAVMVLGLRHTGDATNDPRAKAKLCQRVREFIARFRVRHQSIVCRELLGCDLSTPEGWHQAQDGKLHQTLCPNFVRTAAELLDAT